MKTQHENPHMTFANWGLDQRRVAIRFHLQ